MKRLSEYTHELDKINLKRSKLKHEIFEINDKTVRKQKRKSARDTTRFINNAHISHFPPLRKNTPLPPPINDPLATKLSHIICIAELAQNVLQHLGPQELYILTRVANEMKPIVMKAFIPLAPFYMERYGEALANPSNIKSRDAMKAKCVALVTRCAKFSNSESIEKLLSLWNHYMITYRTYGPEYNKAYTGYDTCNQVYDINYSFVYDKVHNRFMRLCDLKLYTAINYDMIENDFTREWDDKHEDLDFMKHGIREGLSLFRYKHLTQLDLKRIDHTMKVKDTFVIEEGSILKFRDSNYDIHYVRPMSVPRQKMPFMDHYEHRNIYHWSYEGYPCRILKNPYNSSLNLHYDRLKEWVTRYENRVD